MKGEAIKALIELADSVDDADAVIREYTGFTEVKEKIAYLQGLFGVTIFARDGDNINDDYWAILSTIINNKWR